MFDSKFPCGYHTNRKLAILWDFTEEYFPEIYQESTKQRKLWNFI